MWRGRKIATRGGIRTCFPIAYVLGSCATRHQTSLAGPLCGGVLGAFSGTHTRGVKSDKRCIILLQVNAYGHMQSFYTQPPVQRAVANGTSGNVGREQVGGAVDAARWC